jgi:hypothetical protein
LVQFWTGVQLKRFGCTLLIEEISQPPFGKTQRLRTSRVDRGREPLARTGTVVPRQSGLATVFMDDMNAKNLIRENDDMPSMPPRDPGRRPMPRRGDDLSRVMGGGREGMQPPGQFSPREVSQMKDVLVLILAHLANSDQDKQIIEALMAGKEVPVNLLQHVLDEARNVQLPPSHDMLLQKIHSIVTQAPR